MANSVNLFDTNTTSGAVAPNSSTSTMSMPTYNGPRPDYSIWGDIANFFSGNRATQEAKYQEWLNNTAVQRRMWDLKQAGINPVLAAQGQGAGTTAYANGSSQGEHSASKTLLNVGKNALAVATAARIFKFLSLFV